MTPVLDTLAQLDADIAALLKQVETAEDVADTANLAAAAAAAATAAANTALRAETDAKNAAVARLARYTKVPGTYVPDKYSTGLVDPAGLIDVPGDYTYSGAFGVVLIENRRFLGYVFVKGPWARFRNCLFAGPAAPTMEAVQARYPGVHDVVFEDCEFNPRTVNDRCGGITGQGYSLIRCHLHNSVDGATACPVDGQAVADVHLEASLIEDLAYFKPSSTHSDNQTHSDALVIIGSEVTVNGCCIRGIINTKIGTGWAAGVHPYYPNPVAMSAVMFNQRVVGGFTQTPGKVRISNSWFEGGVVCFNLLGVPLSFGAGDVSVIENCRFKHNQGSGTGGWIVACAKGKQAALRITNCFAWDADPLSITTPINPRTDV